MKKQLFLSFLLLCSNVFAFSSSPPINTNVNSVVAEIPDGYIKVNDAQLKNVVKMNESKKFVYCIEWGDKKNIKSDCNKFVPAQEYLEYVLDTKNVKYVGLGTYKQYYGELELLLFYRILD